MGHRITDVRIVDLRVPTSRELDGSDAMNPDPDYSAAYAILETDHADGLEGHGFTFTIGRGNEVCCAAIEALAPRLIGQELESWTGDMAGLWRHVTGDSQLRWIGPDKGAIHLGAAALINAFWDLWAKVEGKPVWKLVCDLSPAEIVSCVDFQHLTDALTPDQALELLERNAPGRAAREAEMRRDGYPAYVTSAGWLGYSEDKMRRLFREGLAAGWREFKVKVGRSVEDDRRRLAIAREEIGPDCALMVDANQVWDVDEAIAHMRELAEFDLTWIEEPTHPDDVLGHAAIRAALAPLGVATGEHCANRILFKQLLQARAIDYCQIDACRLAGLNEVLAVLLLAARFDVPICPHAGGIGLCEYVQHISLIDYIAVSAKLEGRRTEYAAHLHELFVDPVVVEKGRYRVPDAPGYSSTLRPEALLEYRYPDGAQWRDA